MMHHPNMHHQPMSGHPPQHHPAHQGMPAHHQMPPHQMHRENRHLPMHRVGMGPQGSAASMGGHGQPMGGMGSMAMHHGPSQRPPHALRPMHAPPPGQHHNMPPQMKQMRRGFQGSGYSASGPGVMYQQPLPMQTQQPAPERQSTSNGPPASAPQTQTERTEGTSTEIELLADDTTSLLANSKEKTPMCLVNELARYNKIKHQYRLTSETGPAHKKIFTVTLRLGDTEEYTAEGSSIKRAQHAAAGAALARTRHPAPPPRAQPAPAHAHLHRHTGTVMPTVELNALAMKLCQPAIYTSIQPISGPNRPPRPRPPPGLYRMPPPYVHPQSNRLPTPGMIYRVRVVVGGKDWLGEGPTPQSARHDAAAKALQELRPVGESTPTPPATVSAQDCDNAADNSADILNSDLKSPVSLVHELALKRNLSVVFTVKSERGPPHMRVFITLCTVGEMETEGEGNGKKVSKRRAAEKMLDEMRQRWPPALLRARPPPQIKRKQHATKKKPRNLIKESGSGDAVADGGSGGGGSDSGGAAGDNPISRLAMARHAVRARSPQYSVVEERGAARRREFVVECCAPPHRATGLGPNKKTAKRRAAQHVLLAMESGAKGTESSDVPTCSGDSANVNASSPKPADTKRKESESPDGGASGDARQPVPGVLMMDYQQRTGQPQTPNGVSETSATGGAGSCAAGSKDQLMYLAQLLGFTVEFSDFPKRNHGEYLSLVSLSTCPPVMCHGAGATTPASHDQCARAALHALALMGLELPAATAATGTDTAAATTDTAPAPRKATGVPGNTTKPGVLSNGISE